MCVCVFVCIFVCACACVHECILVTGPKKSGLTQGQRAKKHLSFALNTEFSNDCE